MLGRKQVRKGKEKCGESGKKGNIVNGSE